MSHESFGAFPQKIEKQQVIDALKKLIEKGITDPFGTDPNDPEVAAADALSAKWFAQKDEEERLNPELAARINFEKNFFYLDAGFTDPAYAEEVLEEFAVQDLDEAELTDPVLAQEMREKIDFYTKKLLPKSKE